MKKIFILSAALATAVIANAQLHEKIVVKAGDNIGEAISPTGMFRFPNFMLADFLLKDGTRSSAMFNYHIGNGEMMYIGDNGDTMSLGSPEDMVSINFGPTTQFIYQNKAWHEIMLESPAGKLAKKIRVNLENERKGGYGEPAPASSQAQLRNVNFGSRFNLLTYDIAMLKTTTFYWADAKNNLQLVSKKSSVKLVSKDKAPRLEAFIEENKTNFNSEEDLRKLLEYAGSL